MRKGSFVGCDPAPVRMGSEIRHKSSKKVLNIIK